MKALQIPVTLFIHANVSQYTQEKISVFTMDMSQYPEYVLLETRTIHIDVNQPEPIDIIGKQVEALQLESPSGRRHLQTHCRDRRSGAAAALH